MNNFWNNLPQPFFALAPMEDVTDVAFRQMFARYGRYEDLKSNPPEPDDQASPKSSGDDWVSEDGNMRGPDVLWTEFTSADGLVKGGWERLKHQLSYQENERPIVAQLFSAHPGRMRQAAAICYQLGFDGVGINMCCPSQTVVDNDCGSALIKKPKLAQNLIRAAREGAAGLPISVKTRTGFDEHSTQSWIPKLLETEIDALSLHARSRKQMSKVPADWQQVKETREIRDEMGVATLIIGNGDVESLAEAKEKADTYGVDGVMIGRGAFGNPWFFNPEIDRDELSAEKRLSVMAEHATVFEEKLPNQHFAIMRKHFKSYTKGLPQANDLRNELMQTNNASEVKRVVEDYLHNNT